MAPWSFVPGSVHRHHGRQSKALRARRSSAIIARMQIDVPPNPPRIGKASSGLTARHYAVVTLIVGLLVLALILHWLAGKREQAAAPGRQVV